MAPLPNYFIDDLLARRIVTSGNGMTGKVTYVLAHRLHSRVSC
jgi:hypothetical protein